VLPPKGSFASVAELEGWAPNIPGPELGFTGAPIDTFSVVVPKAVGDMFDPAPNKPPYLEVSSFFSYCA